MVGTDGTLHLALMAAPESIGQAREAVAELAEDEGVRPRLEPRPSGPRLGLGPISILSSRFEISGGEDGGTEVLMRVPLQLSAARRCLAGVLRSGSHNLNRQLARPA